MSGRECVHACVSVCERERVCVCVCVCNPKPSIDAGAVPKSQKSSKAEP